MVNLRIGNTLYMEDDYLQHVLGKKFKITYSALVVGLLFALVLQPALLAEITTGTWRGQWIASPIGPARDNAVYHFRKVFFVAKVPSSLHVFVSADNRFVLYVNENRVGNGPATSDIWHWRYEIIDIAPFLHIGNNVIAATVWNFGAASPVAQMSIRTGFLVQAQDIAWRAVDTNASWKVEREVGRSTIAANYRAILGGYYGAAPGEKMDGLQYDWKWMESSDATDPRSHWEHALALGAGRSYGALGDPTPWVLQPDPLPPMEYTPISVGKIVSTSGIEALQPGQMFFTVEPHSRATVLLDAAAMTTGYPRIMMSGGADSQVRVTYAEALVNKDGKRDNRNEVKGHHIVGISDEFLTDGGSQRSFMPLDWRAWRYMQLDITTEDQALRIDNITAWFSAYPLVRRSSFASSDPELNKVWDVGWHTVRLDAHETYMDTPYWERLQYVADTRIEALISYSVSSDDRLARQAIDAFDNSRLPTGLTQSRYPSAWPQVIPEFSLLWIDMLHDFWMYRGDPSYVQSHLTASRAILNWFLRIQRENGMVGRVNWWNQVDWTLGSIDGVPPQDKNGESAAVTLEFIEALRNAADLEQILGDSRRAAEYTGAADRASHAVWKLCWNTTAGLIADTPSQTHFSQQTNVLAVWLHVIPSGLQKEVMRRILSETETVATAGGRPIPVSQASLYFRFYLARALESSGLGNLYISTLGPWRRMLALGLTTWEEKLVRPRSDSHAWSAHPTFDLLRIVAGIRPAAPGFSKIVIEPHLGNLQSLRAVMVHPKGQIEVSYRVPKRGIHAQISVPHGVTSQFIWKGKKYPLKAGMQELNLP